MSIQYVDDWLSSTQQVFTGLSSDEIKSIVESPTPQMSLNDDRIHYCFHDPSKSVPDTRHQEEKHPRSGKTYLGESKAYNVSTPLKTGASFEVPSRPATQASAPLKSLTHQSLLNTSLIDGISNLSINGTKRNSDAHSDSHDPYCDFDEANDVATDEDEEYHGDKNDKDYLHDKSSSLILDEDPLFNLIPLYYNSASTNSSCSYPHLQFKENDEAVVFYKDIRSIDDQTWLPRTFQNHRITQAQFHRPDGFRYMKNSKCPKSPATGEDFADGSRSKSTYPYAEASHLEKFTLHHYMRTLNLNRRKVELLCRFCRGKNWVPKSKYDTHLALSHGILQLPEEKLPFLLPYPLSMFKNMTGPFINYSVECSVCSRWILLGHPLDGPNIPELKTQGLYFNYFAHFVTKHKDYVEG